MPITYNIYSASLYKAKLLLIVVIKVASKYLNKIFEKYNCSAVAEPPPMS
jgi:hypothetical protein